jgi:hypothetical protein
MADPLGGPGSKIARARKHLDDLASETRAYLRSQPPPIALLSETTSHGTLILRLRLQRRIPDALPLILGDCVHNLRSALDILACDIIRHAGGTITQDSGFPIVGDAARLPAAITKRLQGAGSSAQNAVAACQPFKGADNPLWALHQLDIVDKHRVLLTVAGAGTGIDIGDMAGHQLRQKAKEAGFSWADGIEVPNLFIRSARIDCYEDGAIVAEQPVGEGIDRIKYGFDIAVSEPSLVECKPIVPLGSELVEFVDGVVRSLSKTLV